MTGPLLGLINGLGGGDWLTVIVNLIVIVVLLLIAFPIHEFAHAYVATKLGDDTPRLMGRLTLNPIAHLDVFGSLLFLISGWGWAKPVPVNTYRLNAVGGSRNTAMAVVALAGPVSNLIIALVFGLLYRIAEPMAQESMASAIIAYASRIAVQLNIFLALFNLIPVPPLDGSKILAAFLPDNGDRIMAQLQQYGFILLIVLSVSGALGAIINPPARALTRLFLGI